MTTGNHGNNLSTQGVQSVSWWQGSVHCSPEGTGEGESGGLEDSLREETK